MKYALMIVECVDPTQMTELNGTYVKHYDPSYWPDRSVPYDGGRLVTTLDRNDAKHFDTPIEAFEYWRQSFGNRPDGQPNRPLTAFTVTVAPLECELVEENSITYRVVRL